MQKRIFPKISVIIPLYNSESFLKECLGSVTAQDLSDIEIILVDDGSIDNTLNLCLEFQKKDPRIKIYQQEHLGPGSARNIGIQKATGEFLAFIDSDDLYPNSHTLSILYKSAKNRKALICGGNVKAIGNSKWISSFEKENKLPKTGWIKFKEYQNDYCFWRFIYNTSFIKQNQIYFPNYFLQEDPIFLVKAMLKARKFFALKIPSYIYRLKQNFNSYYSLRHAEDAAKSMRELLEISYKENLNQLHNRMANRLNDPFFKRLLSLLRIENIPSKNLKNLIDEINYPMIFEISPDFSLAYCYKRLKNLCKISIVIPVYNSEKYLKDCLQSISSQNYKNFEVFCVNDGSTDNSLKILNEFQKNDKRFKIINTKNEGCAAARNKALKMCNSEFVIFIDSDDIIPVNYIAELYFSAIVDNIDVVFCPCKVFSNIPSLMNETNSLQKCFDRVVKKTGVYSIKENILNNVQMTLWGKVFKLSIILKNDINFPEKLYTSEEHYFIWLYVYYCSNFFFLNSTKYYYRRHPDSLTHNYFVSLLSDLFFSYQKLFKRQKKWDENLKKVTAYGLAKHIYDIYPFNFSLTRKMCSELKKCIKENSQLKNFLLITHNKKIKFKNIENI